MLRKGSEAALIPQMLGAASEAQAAVPWDQCCTEMWTELKQFNGLLVKRLLLLLVLLLLLM